MEKKKNIARQSNWPGLLALFIAINQNKKFEFGTNDCAMLAANWVSLATTKNFGKQYKYQSNLGADRILKSSGGVRGIADKYLPRVKLNFAKRGDLVALRVNPAPPAWKNTSLGILLGREAVFAGPKGLTFIPRNELLKIAWRVG
jgi:hypothetical protein